MSERRLPCPRCQGPVLEGARKCPACKSWLVTSPLEPAKRSRLPQIALGLFAAVGIGMGALVAGRPDRVGEAPPLTNLPSSPTATASAPSPAGIGPEPDPTPEPADDRTRPWRARDIPIGGAHPLDLVWNPNGKSVYVSTDDAMLREYRIDTGELIHRASMPAQGDSIRLLFGRYVAILRKKDASRIPIMDVTAWDRDPILLHIGPSPGDVVELPDGKSIVASTNDGKRVIRFELPSGTRMGDITLPHATGQLFLVSAEGRPHVAAMGGLTYGGRPAGAWIDLFDPSEVPFGATRRSIAVGREPRRGAVTRDGEAIFFPDRVANTATLLRIAAISESKTADVGQQPIAAFLLEGDRFGVTLNSGARSASVIDLGAMKLRRTLMLNGEPRAGKTSSDGSTLFVALGGAHWPPEGSGAMVIAGDPPGVVASLATGKGATSVAVSRDGTRAAIANYYSKSITIIER